MSDHQWMRTEPIKGGHVVFCNLCGRKLTRRFFHASDTNYAEALRLAVAYEATHRMSEMHSAALAAFHSEEVPVPSKEEVLIAKAFNEPPPTERELRKRAAGRAAKRAARAKA